MYENIALILHNTIKKRLINRVSINNNAYAEVCKRLKLNNICITLNESENNESKR